MKTTKKTPVLTGTNEAAKPASKQTEKFTVKTKGYQETFGDINSAKAQYDLLKKRSVKSQESIKLELYSFNEHGIKKDIENVSIGEGFFN
ncbi:MAG: hypothetical protein ABI402_02985 [Ferruginibacter sp.]